MSRQTEANERNKRIADAAARAEKVRIENENRRKNEELHPAKLKPTVRTQVSDMTIKKSKESPIMHSTSVFEDSEIIEVWASSDHGKLTK